MDGFPPMPAEILRLIAVEMVKARSVKRAVRLRLVNRSWNREISQAIVESGMIDGHRRVYNSVFWPRLLMHKIRDGSNLPSRPLRVIYRAAQRVVAFRTGKPDTDNHEALQDYLWEICQLSPKANANGSWYESWFTPDEEMEPINDSDEDFRETLLAAATATNDLVLVKELLSTMQDVPYLVWQNGYKEEDPLLGSALDIAAFLGHNEVLRTLLEIKDDPSDILVWCMDFANMGNQLGTLDMCLEEEYDWPRPGLIEALEHAATIPIFDRLYSICKDHLPNSRTGSPSEPKLSKVQTQVELLSANFRRAARNGNLELMKHLVQLGAHRKHIFRGNDESGWLVCRIAEEGHADVLKYLLDNGSLIDPRALEAACEHGNPAVVRTLIEHGAKDTNKPGSALINAVTRENDAALRMLLETGTLWEENQRRQALEVAEKEGLSSMVKALKEFEGVCN